MKNSTRKILAERMGTDGREKGLIIIAVLWVVMILNVIVAMLGHNSRLDMKVRQVRTEEYRCKWACRAGIETAIGVLNEDLRASDCLADLWSDNDEDFNNVGIEECRFSVRVIDEAGKLNINTATRGQLLALPYMEPYIADAIIDWRDENGTISGEGAEGGYYQNLPFGYAIRNGPFKTIRELLLVKDVTEQLLYGPPPRLASGDAGAGEGGGRTTDDPGFAFGYAEAGRGQTTQASPSATPRQADEGWIAEVSCYSYDRNIDGEGNGRININESDESQLRNSLGIKRSVARWIVARRENKRFESISDLIDNESPAAPEDSGSESEPLDLQTFSAIADRITADKNMQTQGKVNVNTASKEVLTALFGSGDEAIAIAESIIAYRRGLIYGMQSIGELLNVLSIDNFKKIANSVTTRSNVFTIRCFATADRGSSDGVKLLTEVVVDRSSSPCRVLYWYQGAGN